MVLCFNRNSLNDKSLPLSFPSFSEISSNCFSSKNGKSLFRIQLGNFGCLSYYKLQKFGCKVKDILSLNPKIYDIISL